MESTSSDRLVCEKCLERDWPATRTDDGAAKSELLGPGDEPQQAARSLLRASMPPPSGPAAGAGERLWAPDSSGLGLRVGPARVPSDASSSQLHRRGGRTPRRTEGTVAKMQALQAAGLPFAARLRREGHASASTPAPRGPFAQGRVKRARRMCCCARFGPGVVTPPRQAGTAAQRPEGCSLFLQFAGSLSVSGAARLPRHIGRKAQPAVRAQAGKQEPKVSAVASPGQAADIFKPSPVRPPLSLDAGDTGLHRKTAPRLQLRGGLVSQLFCHSLRHTDAETGARI